MFLFNVLLNRIAPFTIKFFTPINKLVLPDLKCYSHSYKKNLSLLPQLSSLTVAFGNAGTAKSFFKSG